MKVNQEISRATAILRKKGDRLSLIQAEVLESGHNEEWVFEQYVTSVPEAGKDEAAFFSARDAARFLAGKLALEELIPDVEEYPEEVTPPSDGYVRVPVREFHELIQAISRLEKKIDDLCGNPGLKPYQQTPDFEKNDLMTQEKACKYVGCSKVTIRSWSRKGLIKGYRKGSHVYYSQSELDHSPAVLNFRNITPDSYGNQ